MTHYRGAGGSMDRAFTRAVLFTAAPIVAASALSVAGAENEIFYALWFIATGAAIVALLIGMVLLLWPERRAAGSGMLTGVAISAVALTVTCFANLSIFF